MNIIEKLKTIAENEPKVYEAGEVAGYKKGETEGYNKGYDAGEDAGYASGYTNGELKHINRYATAIVAGDGTKTISFDCPFEPDYVCVMYHGAGAMSSAVSLISMLFDMRSFAVTGGMYIVRMNSTNYFGTVSSATGKNFFKWADGICQVDIPSSINVTYLNTCQYTCTAVKYTDKTDRELLEEEIALLADTGDALQYSSARVLATMTQAEWNTLIATKPNRTFTLK